MTQNKNNSGDTTKRRSLKLTGLGLRTAARLSQNKISRSLFGEEKLSSLNKIGEDWFSTLGNLKGAPMKFGQFASQFGDLLPETIATQLRKLQNQATPLPLSELTGVLDAAWGENWQQSIQIEPTAIAAASIGQVHRAKLLNESINNPNHNLHSSIGEDNIEEVVVKIRYPDIEAAFELDMKALKRLIKLGRVLDIDKHDLDAIFAEIRTKVAEEMDFAQELANLHMLRQQQEADSQETDNSENIIYPKPITELCRDDVLVMTYEAGDHAEVAQHYPLSTRQQIADSLFAQLLEQILVHGVVHADPNLGNFAFRPNGQVVMYDFGCVKQVPAALQQQLRAALIAFSTQDWQSVHDHFMAMGGIPAEPQYQDPPVELYELWYNITMRRFLTERPFDFGDPQLHDDFVQAIKGSIAYRKHFKPVPDMVFVNRTISGMYWLLRKIGGQVDIASLFVRYQHSAQQDEHNGSHQ